MKMQEIKFSSISEMLEFLPEDELEIVISLREIIIREMPLAQEKLSYNVLYYFGQKRIVYIWPGSIAWGTRTTKGVELGFCYGHLLKENQFLEKNGRSQVSSKRFFSISQINTHFIENLLIEAKEIDELHQTKIT